MIWKSFESFNGLKKLRKLRLIKALNAWKTWEIYCSNLTKAFKLKNFWIISQKLKNHVKKFWSFFKTYKKISKLIILFQQTNLVSISSKFYILLHSLFIFPSRQITLFTRQSSHEMISRIRFLLGHD